MGNKSCSCIPSATLKDINKTYIISAENALILDYCGSTIDEKEIILLNELKKVRKIQKKNKKYKYKRLKKHQRKHSNKQRIKRINISNNPFPSVINEENEEEKTPMTLSYINMNTVSDIIVERSTSMPTPIPNDYFPIKKIEAEHLSTDMDSEVWKYLAKHPSGMFTPVIDNSPPICWSTVKTPGKNINGNNYTESNMDFMAEEEGKADYSTVVLSVENENGTLNAGKGKEDAAFCGTVFEAKSLSVAISSDDEENAEAVDVWKKKMTPVTSESNAFTYLSVDKLMDEKSEEEIEMDIYFQALSMENVLIGHELNDHPSATNTI